MLNRLKLERVWLVLGAILAGVLLGVGVAEFPVYLALPIAAALAAVGAWQLIRNPHWTAITFWIAFALESTVVEGVQVQGLYYPLYLLILCNVILALHRGYSIPWRIVTLYALFYSLVLFQLFNLAGEADFVVFQRLFIYLLGLLTLFQFLTLNAVRWFQRAQAWAGLIVAVVVLMQSLGGSVAERGSLDANPNNVTVIIALGVISLFATLMIRRPTKLITQVLAWLGILIACYAVLILASRGMAIGLAVALIVVFSRTVLDLKKSLPVVIGAVILSVVLTGLPGADNLAERLTQADVSSLNSRVPLWTAAWEHFTEGSPLEILFGHGFMSSSVIAREASGVLTSLHNSYLQMLVEYGIVGLVLFVFLHLVVVRAVWPHKNAVALTALGSIVFLMMAGMSATQSDDFLYWVALGAGLAAAALVPGAPVSSSEPSSSKPASVPRPSA